MRRVHSADTGPELEVRRMVSALGMRFRLHSKELPGRPDLVFSRRRQVIFVHGCYWHQHRCAAAKRPASNRRYWNRKLDGNMERDRRNLQLLRRQGWRVLTAWECELRNPEGLKRRLLRFFRLGVA
jgi:DNA mismatch endonuclease, patch repair protein